MEERVFTLKFGALNDYRNLYLKGGYNIQRAILGEPLGYLFSDIGTQNQVVHIWRYESHEDRETIRAELLRKPNWQNYIRKAGRLVELQENSILKPLL